MKIAVLDFLKKEYPKPVDRFNDGMGLLMRTPEASTMLQRNYNARGYTPQSLESLEYDLKKIYGISDADIRKHIIEIPEENNVIVGGGTVGYDQALFMAANKDLFTNVLQDMNETEKSGLKMYDRYPFLREEDCPNEFKILTADAITAFHNFKEAHTELFNEVVLPENTELTNEEIYAIAAKLLSDFELNREIHVELEYYAKNNEILGEHEIFADLKKQRELDALTSADLSRKIGNIASNISKKKTKLGKTTDKDLKNTLSEEIKALEKEKAELNARLQAKK
ncbi:hypothetical protein CMT42_14795 [Elizabethkingia anophelis]|uniref:hypothetical protein n=1 Tax=Elizabethkingia anophelis TaxID=1117645 RepID=UPI00099A9BD6|nr:hypothetical protein [Elizabethkingia anophelis]MDV3669168.1 hypothetical protein [Elizabethkingia anophelis]MDV3894520.1 hypothetical protein [Elizabethkingia anophelis]MDV3914529.1 hypothetical protein [Elizabethkingia anophelis]MDV3920723.1 hypothetical protein [Elizabethkingia anophelis]MDV3959190.1 hypothetical protein [Elizabethkingia anophelis]